MASVLVAKKFLVDGYMHNFASCLADGYMHNFVLLMVICMLFWIGVAADKEVL